MEKVSNAESDLMLKRHHQNIKSFLIHDFITSNDGYRKRTKHDINSMEIEFLTEATA